ncbi:TPA: cysteine peptidase family C39 domain-containing protein [Providencia rettgeri]
MPSPSHRSLGRLLLSEFQRGSNVGHWVVVKAVDNEGNVIINSPFKGTRYTMKVNEFKDAWNGYRV